MIEEISTLEERIRKIEDYIEQCLDVKVSGIFKEMNEIRKLISGKSFHQQRMEQIGMGTDNRVKDEQK